MASLLPPNSDAYNALVCRDYTRIDQFAEEFRRDVLWERLLNKGRLGISPIVAKDLHARAAMYQIVADELRPTQEPPSNELIEINKKLQDVEKLIKEANGGNGKNVKDAQDALDDLDMNNAFKIVLERARTEKVEKIKKVEKEIDAKLMERDAIIAVTKGMDREMAIYLWEECVEQGLVPKMMTLAERDSSTPGLQNP